MFFTLILSLTNRESDTMKRTIIVALVLLPFSMLAQSSDKDEILEVVYQVFEAMRTSDSTMLKDAFIKEPVTNTIFTNKEGIVQFRTGDFQHFAEAVGTPKDDVWNEPIWNEKVEIDGPLASVWVDYAFYLNNDFIHCGVDAFDMVKKDGVWKIFHLVDTRRKATCVIPEEVQQQFKD